RCATGRRRQIIVVHVVAALLRRRIYAGLCPQRGGDNQPRQGYLDHPSIHGFPVSYIITCVFRNYLVVAQRGFARNKADNENRSAAHRRRKIVAAHNKTRFASPDVPARRSRLVWLGLPTWLIN